MPISSKSGGNVGYILRCMSQNMESGGVHLILGQYILALYLNDKVTVYNWLHLNILSQFFNVMELFGHCPKEPDFKRGGLRPLGGTH